MGIFTWFEPGLKKRRADVSILAQNPSNGRILAKIESSAQ